MEGHFPRQLLDKLMAFHREHETPLKQVLVDLQAAVEKPPRSAYSEEAAPLLQQLQTIRSGTGLGQV